MRAIATPLTRSRSGPRATQPSGAPATVRTTGPQGTLGGKAGHTSNRKPGVNKQAAILGQEVYLWILVAVELFVLGALRKYFRRRHGG